MNMPSMPEPVGGDAADERADDLAEREEDRVEAHDRAAVRREALGHVGEQAEGRRRRAGQHEQAAGRDDAGHDRHDERQVERDVVDDEARHDQRRRRR